MNNILIAVSLLAYTLPQLNWVFFLTFFGILAYLAYVIWRQAEPEAERFEKAEIVIFCITGALIAFLGAILQYINGGYGVLGICIFVEIVLMIRLAHAAGNDHRGDCIKRAEALADKAVAGLKEQAHYQLIKTLVKEMVYSIVYLHFTNMCAVLSSANKLTTPHVLMKLDEDLLEELSKQALCALKATDLAEKRTQVRGFGEALGISLFGGLNEVNFETLYRIFDAEEEEEPKPVPPPPSKPKAPTPAPTPTSAPVAPRPAPAPAPAPVAPRPAPAPTPVATPPMRPSFPTPPSPGPGTPVSPV